MWWIKTIRITKTPTGEAPEWVRQAWVDLKLPLQQQEDESPSTFGVLRKGGATPRPNCWKVRQNKALRVLRKKEPLAAQWWKIRGYPMKRSLFTFAADEAVLL